MKRKVKLSQTQQTILTALANAPSYSLGMLQLLDHLGYVFPIVLLPRVEHGIMSLYRQGCLQFSWHINAENVPLNCLEVDALSLTTLVRWNEHKQEWTLQLPDPAVIDLMIDLNLGSAEALHIFQQEHMTTTLHRRNATPTYQAALDYLYSFINYENKMPPSPDHARFNLDRMHWLLGELGDPHGHYPSVVVAGTKGKGSTSAMLESILRAAGYRSYAAERARA